jgi:hypothetical protein
MAAAISSVVVVMGKVELLEAAEQILSMKI